MRIVLIGIVIGLCIAIGCGDNDPPEVKRINERFDAIEEKLRAKHRDRPDVLEHELYTNEYNRKTAIRRWECNAGIETQACYFHD